MSDPKVINLILNTNRREDTLACLGSLKENTYQNHLDIVLDCASTDGSVEAIRFAYPQVQVISLIDNRGYAGNNNIGIKEALKQGADWVFVLNEDTILDKDCISKLIEVGKSDDSIGIVGPMVYHFSEPNVIQSAGGIFGPAWNSIHLGQDMEDRGEFCEPHQVGWISGCGIMLRRQVIEQVGMLDERFFYYWEETEWCMRAGEAGWKIVHVPLAKLWHKGVQRDNRPKPTVTYYSTRNHLLLLKKHKAPLHIWAITWFELARTLLSWTIKPKWKTKREHRMAMWRGIQDYWGRRWGGPVQL